MQVLTTKLAEARTVLLIDGHNLAWRASFIYSKIKFKVIDDPIKFGMSRMLLKILKLVSLPALLIFALDNYPQKRKRIYREYKGNRAIVKASVTDPIPALHELICSIPCWQVQAIEQEADDVLCSVFYQITRKKRNVLVSTDKDLYQLFQPPKLTIYTDKFLTLSDVLKPFTGLQYPSKIPFYKSVLGDASDNIPPVKPRLSRKEVAHLANRAKFINHFVKLLVKHLNFNQEEIREVVIRYNEFFRLKPNLKLQLDVYEGLLDKYLKEGLDEVQSKQEELAKSFIQSSSVWV